MIYINYSAFNCKFNVSDSTMRIKLHSTIQILSVDRSHMVDLVMQSKDISFSIYSPTSVYSAGGQTCMYNRYEAEEPMLGSQTPMYNFLR